MLAGSEVSSEGLTGGGFPSRLMYMILAALSSSLAIGWNSLPSGLSIDWVLHGMAEAASGASDQREYPRWKMSTFITWIWKWHTIISAVYHWLHRPTLVQCRRQYSRKRMPGLWDHWKPFWKLPTTSTPERLSGFDIWEIVPPLCDLTQVRIRTKGTLYKG